MKFNFKKQIAALISATLMLTSVAVPTFAAGGAGGSGGGSNAGGGTNYFEKLAYEVGYVYDYVDPTDSAAISGVASKLNSLTADKVADSAVESLMTEKFVEKYNSRAEAKSALVTLLGNSLGVYFSNGEAELAQALENADSKILTTIEKALNVGRTNEWFDLFLLTKKESQDIATTADKKVWAIGSTSGNTDSLDELFETMDALQIKAMNKKLAEDDYADLGQTMAQIGWIPENVVAACRGIMAVADQSNVGEFALIKAAARSTAMLTGLDEDLVKAGVDLEENVIKCQPNGLDKYVVSLDVLDWNVTNLVGYSTTNEDLISFETDEVDKVIIVKVNEDVKGTADVVLKRDPLGDNSGSDKDWIVRFRVVVANEIGKATDFAVDNETGEFTWKKADNAVKYSVNIYKDGVKIDTVEVTEEKINFMDWAEVKGNGKYTADVTAYGDIPEEVGEVADGLLEFDYTEALDTVKQPTWEDKVLKWEAVTGATSYEVKLYKGEATEPATTVTVTDGTSCDFEEYLKNETGTFYATVQAKGDNDVVGGVSEKSEGIFVQKLYKVSGVVKLEDAEQGTVKEDNSGIVVTLNGLEGAVMTTELKDGSYSFENVPNGDDYTLWFEYKYYLKGIQPVVVKDGDVIVDDEILYFGDFRNSGTKEKIDHIDLPMLPSLYGVTKELHPDKFDDYMDIYDDDVIDAFDLSVVIRNVNKEA